MKAVLQNWLKECHPEFLAGLELVTIEQWDEYDRLIDLYLSGTYCDIGWLALIESNLVRVGVEKHTAYLMASGRKAFQ